MLKSFRSDIKDGHQLNSYLEILQTTSSSKTNICPHEQKLDWMNQANRDLEMYLSFHLDTKDGYALYSLYGILQTTSSKFYALLRLRIA